MLKLNDKDEAELYKDWNGSFYGRSDYMDPEGEQMDCLLTLEERTRMYPSLLEKWQEKLTESSRILETAEKKMRIYYGTAGGLVLLTLIFMMIVVGLEMGSTVVMLTTGLILLIMTGVFILIFLGINVTCFYGVHSEWKVFRKYIEKYQVHTLKSKNAALVNGIRFMEEECRRAEAYRDRLKKGGQLAEEEYQWALSRMEVPELPIHTENLAENIGKKDRW